MTIMTTLFENAEELADRLGVNYDVSTQADSEDETITVSWESFVNEDRERDIYQNELGPAIRGLRVKEIPNSYHQADGYSFVIFDLTDSN